jgi:hypothetical protein
MPIKILPLTNAILAKMNCKNDLAKPKFTIDDVNTKVFLVHL